MGGAGTALGSDNLGGNKRRRGGMIAIMMIGHHHYCGGDNQYYVEVDLQCDHEDADEEG